MTEYFILSEQELLVYSRKLDHGVIFRLHIFLHMHV